MKCALLACIVCAGCWRSASEPPALSHRSTTHESEWVVTQRGVGPFDATTVATEAALRTLVPGLRVAAHDLGGEAGIVYDVFDGPERLAYVVPDDAPGWTDELAEHRYATTTFAVFVVTPRIRVRGYSWRVGSPLAQLGVIEECECWGETVTACQQHASHIQVIFERACDEATLDPRQLVGKRIDRIMWKRTLGLDESPQAEPHDVLGP